MTTTDLALPDSVRPDTWNADTAALMEFAGLTWTEQSNDGPVRKFAPSGIMAAFIAACRTTGLDPTAKQIYAAQMGGKWTVLVGIDGFRVVAQRSGEYDGQDPIEWQAEENGPWTTVPPKTPHAARVRIYRKGIGRPLEQTVTLAEFGGSGGNWAKRPAHMLGIRAESHGFRRAFPMQLAGLYTPEDFQDEVTDTSDAITVPALSEDWAKLITDAKTREELDAIRERMRPEATEKLKAAWFARAGVLAREEQTVDAELVEDGAVAETAVELTPEEFEAAEAARFDTEHTEAVDRD